MGFGMEVNLSLVRTEGEGKEEDGKSSWCNWRNEKIVFGQVHSIGTNEDPGPTRAVFKNRPKLKFDWKCFWMNPNNWRASRVTLSTRDDGQGSRMKPKSGVRSTERSNNRIIFLFHIFPVMRFGSRKHTRNKLMARVGLTTLPPYSGTNSNR